MSFIVRGTVALAVAGLLTLTGAEGVAPAGEYGGPTSQKVDGSALWITLTVVDGALAKVDVGAIVDHGGPTCSLTEDSSSFDFGNGSVRVDHQGNFAGTLKDPSSDSVKIGGRFTGNMAAGWFEITARGVGQTTTACNTGSVTFRASAAGGQAKDTRYSGTVGPGYPISFRVSTDGNELDDLAVGIEATCQPGAGDIAPVYDFGALRITSGSFSGSVFAQHGPTVSDLVRISGSFFGHTAVGLVTDLSHIKSLPDCTESEPFTATAR
jgi:hypothetical protein